MNFFLIISLIKMSDNEAINSTDQEEQEYNQEYNPDTIETVVTSYDNIAYNSIADTPTDSDSDNDFFADEGNSDHGNSDGANSDDSSVSGDLYVSNGSESQVGEGPEEVEAPDTPEVICSPISPGSCSCGGSGSSGSGDSGSGSSGSGDSGSGSSLGSVLSDLQPIIEFLTPLMMSYLSSSSSSSSKTPCPATELLSGFNEIWDGLDQIGNKKIRAICFMDRLNKFHETLWKYARENSSKDTSGILGSTALSLTEEKMRNEISNVMKQLSK